MILLVQILPNGNQEYVKELIGKAYEGKQSIKFESGILMIMKELLKQQEEELLQKTDINNSCLEFQLCENLNAGKDLAEILYGGDNVFYTYKELSSDEQTEKNGYSIQLYGFAEYLRT